jgi:MFS family permease
LGIEQLPDSGHHNDTANVALGAWGLLVAVLFLMLGSGLLGTVIGLRAELAGFGDGTIGIVLAGYYAGFLAGAWVVPRFVGTVGHIRVYAALASLASVAALVHALTELPAVWLLMRVVTGFAMSGLYLVAEGWLNEKATNATRGRLLSVYMIVVMGGIALSQLLLTVADPSGSTLFILASILVSFAVVPVTLSAGSAPDTGWARQLPVRRIWDAAPAGVVGGFGAGFTNGGIMALGAVYASRVGMSVDRIAIYMGLLVLGSVILQWPIGALSDRMPRRRAIMVVSVAAALAAAGNALVDPAAPAALLAVFIFGGLTFPLYSLCLSHINDHVPAGTTIAVSAVYVFVAGVGAVLGPLAGSVAMSTLGAPGLFWMMLGVHLAVAGFALGRVRVRRGLPVEQQRRFTLVPSRGGAVMVHLARRHGRNGARSPSKKQ